MRLILVFGDQLSHDLAGLRVAGGDDVVWLAESSHEIEYVWSHKLRIVGFLSAMRHFRDELRSAGRAVWYHELGEDPASDAGATFGELLEVAVGELSPEALVVTRPGDWRVLAAVREAAASLGLPLELEEDDRFICDLAAFDAWADGRKRLVLEDFYRMMRREHGVLLDGSGEPLGGRWNYDEDNRESFGREGPPSFKPPRRFRTDGVTDGVVSLVEARWPGHPGRLEHVDLPVTHGQALALLRDFLEHRLEAFGTYQDAMWGAEPFLAHSRLSMPLNLGLLDPWHCVTEAERAHREKGARLASVEGFIRQVLGWREFVRGVYWRYMPDYAEGDALGADREVPHFLWDGDTDMECVARAMDGLLDHAYAHHIQRLMVLGLFCLLYGVDPRRFNDWHLAMYADAVDWASLPNTLGMSQYGDGGVVGSKPYCASGRYIDRMSNHCRDCRYDPKLAVGDDACPFTTLYWDFLARHEGTLRDNRRMGFQYANLDRKDPSELVAIRDRARGLKAAITRETRERMGG